MSSQYEVLSPWAEVDPVPSRGISPRLTDMTDKKIGLFRNTKPSALAMQTLVEAKLKERFPTLKFSSFVRAANVSVAETEDKAKFEEWVKGLDAVICAVGD
jgi:hypothetical protein